MEFGSALGDRGGPAAETEAQKLAGLEACRGLAAIAVLLYHSARHIDRAYGVDTLRGIFQFGHAGVDLFFVISGFVISYVHQDDLGQPARLAHYAGRRLTRILPIYWVALSVILLMGVAGGHAFPAIGELILSALLIPSNAEPLLGVAWTLQYEMVFYAIFAVMILNRGAGLAVSALWLIWIAQTKLAGGPGMLPGSLYGIYNIEFFLGMGVAWWLTRHPVPVPRTILAAGMLLFAASAMAENAHLIDGYADSGRLAYGLPAALILLGLAASERQGLLSVPGLLLGLGRSSYSLYLFQFIYIGAAWKLCQTLGIERAIPPSLAFLLLAGCAIAGGSATSCWVEYPLMRLIRRGFARSTGP